MKPRAVVLTGLLAALVLAAFAAPRLLRSERDRATERQPALRSAPPPVQVHTVTPQRLAETLVAPGTLVANERVDIVSEVAGTVAQISFDEGAVVAAGDLLVKIDDRELVAERQRAAARLELAERRSQRQRELHQQGLISDDELETATTESDALRAELSQIEVRLAKTEIRAPFAGTVGLRRVSQGAYLSPQTRIATLVDNDPMKLEFSVPERYAGGFGPGAVVSFRVEGIAGERRATIYAVEPIVDPATRTVPMRARSPNPGGELLPGGFADVTFAVREVADALTVPSIAVIAELGGKKVYVVEDGKAQPRQVETGIRTDDRVEIIRGLAPGDRVITSGLQLVRTGLEVEVEVEAEAGADQEPAS